MLRTRSGLTFRHGVHPPEHKVTATVPIRRLPFPERLHLPLSQHAGKPARPIVAAGDRVERGDTLAVADGHVSVPVHASAAGTVTGIELWPHQDGSWSPAVHLAVDPYSSQVPRRRIIPDWRGLDRERLVAAVKDAGLVGLGGAAFPTHVKLVPPEGHRVETLIVNGCECEPYLTTDHRTMAEHPDRVLLGIRILMQCLGVDRARIGIERNKPDAIEAIRAALPEDLDIDVLALRTRYPQGAEKMLIEAITGREVPSGKLPVHVGVVVQNVASVATIAEVFETGLPLVERIITVSGPGVRTPRNLLVPIGTRIRDLIDACDGLTDDAVEVISGGPMMGNSIANLDAPVMKGTTGIVVLAAEDVTNGRSLPCIRCGRCLDACPVFLNPQLLGALGRAQRFEAMQEAHLADCMLCGCCSYVCPSRIPLSQLFRASRTELRRRSR